MKTVFWIAACTLFLGACSEVGGMPAAASKGDISQNRTTAFKSFMPNFSSMRKIVNGDDAYVVDTFKAKAAQFAQEARVPCEYFQNDPQGNGDALPNIWQNAAAFQAEQTQFLAAVDKLNAAAQSGNLEQIRTAYGETEKLCQSCHQTYRRPR